MIHVLGRTKQKCLADAANEQVKAASQVIMYQRSRLEEKDSQDKLLIGSSRQICDVGFVPGRLVSVLASAEWFISAPFPACNLSWCTMKNIK